MIHIFKKCFQTQKAGVQGTTKLANVIIKVFRVVISVPTQVVTLTQVVISDNLGLTQVITMVSADPSGNFLPQITYTR